MTCRCTARYGVALIVLSAGLARAQDPGVKVKGRVIDANGRPVAGADVASFWSAGKEDGDRGAIASRRRTAVRRPTARDVSL